MNSPQVNQALLARNPNNGLGKLLANERDNALVVTELYLRCLAREPSQQELETCLEYVRTTSDRTVAFEDISWSLINSAEFRLRR